MASVAQIDLDTRRPPAERIGPQGGTRLTPHEREEKLELDSATNAAAYFDPATYSTLTALGGRTDDARAEGWKHLKRMLRLADVGGDAAVGFSAQMGSSHPSCRGGRL